MMVKGFYNPKMVFRVSLVRMGLGSCWIGEGSPGTVAIAVCGIFMQRWLDGR